MKQGWAVFACCLTLFALYALPCGASTPVRPLGYVETPTPAWQAAADSALGGASLSSKGYIGVYADANHSVCNVFPAQYSFFDAWVSCLPSVNGMIAAEFRLVNTSSSTIIPTATVTNPHITVALGDVWGGISVAFDQCNMDWVWTHHLTFVSLSTDTPSQLQIGPNPSAGAYQFATCELGYPIEPCYIMNPLLINQSCMPDYYPPYLSWVHTLSQTELEAQYNERVTKASAESLANYYVCTEGCAESVPITSITLQADQKTISISLGSPIAQGIEYFFGYINIVDLVGNIHDWRSLAPFGYLPDLVVSRPSAEPDSIYVDTPQMTVGYRIRNAGDWLSGPFDVTIHWASPTNTQTVAVIPYSGLAPGDSLEDAVTIDVPTITDGGNVLRFFVDYGNQIVEKNESNNRADKSVFVYLPNLTAYNNDVTLEPSAATDCATTMKVRYRIRNIGSLDAAPCSVSIRLGLPSGYQLLTTSSCPSLSIGASFVDSFTTTLPPDLADDNRIKVTVNDPRSVIESFYSDNDGIAFFVHYPPRIISVEDCPNDAGGYVRVTFYRSGWDKLAIRDPVTRYDIVCENSGLIVGTLPATRATYYVDTVATVADSVAGGFDWSVYRVRAVQSITGTADTMYRYSCADSGYSVDSRIATYLQSFAVSVKDLRVETTWRIAEGSGTPEFFVLRANEPDGEFAELPSSGIRAEKSAYVFVDSGVEPGEAYRYRVEYFEAGARHLLFESQRVEVPALPLTLWQNVPNPFNPSTTIRYYLPEACFVRLEVFDIGGRRIATLAEGREIKGAHSVEWRGVGGDGRQVASGIYFCRISAGKETLSRKMILMR